MLKIQREYIIIISKIRKANQEKEEAIAHLKNYISNLTENDSDGGTAEK